MMGARTEPDRPAAAQEDRPMSRRLTDDELSIVYAMSQGDYSRRDELTGGWAEALTVEVIERRHAEIVR